MNSFAVALTASHGSPTPVPSTPVLGGPLCSATGPEAHRDPSTQGLLSLTGPPGPALWVWKAPPVPRPLPGFLLGPLGAHSHSNRRGNPQRPRWMARWVRRTLAICTPPSALGQCLLARSVPCKAACSWRAGGLLAQCPISSGTGRREEGGRWWGPARRRCAGQGRVEREGRPGTRV